MPNIGQENDPRRFKKQTKEQKENLATRHAVEDGIENFCSVCGLSEFFTKLTNVGGNVLECVRCLRETA